MIQLTRDRALRNWVFDEIAENMHREFGSSFMEQWEPFFKNIGSMTSGVANSMSNGTSSKMFQIADSNIFFLKIMITNLLLIAEIHKRTH
ncbi:hypothetical protein Lser_V15G45249 [Lactuca serriola]